MISPHPVLSYVVGFDVIICILLARFLWVARTSKVRLRIPASWIVIIALVNLAGLFCPVGIEAAVAGLGGLALVVLIVAAIGRLTPRQEPAKSPETNASAGR